MKEGKDGGKEKGRDKMETRNECIHEGRKRKMNQHIKEGKEGEREEGWEGKKTSEGKGKERS